MQRNHFCMITYCLLAYAMLFQTHSSWADPMSSHLINVKDLGAVGDGKADDTQAIQEALNLVDANGSDILIPAGTYRITQTLTLKTHAGRGTTLRGQGSTPWKHWPKTSTLKWDGAEGGTLIHTAGIGGSQFMNMNFDGNNKAGILFLATTPKGWGNMLNSMYNLNLYNADIGIQMGETAGEHNDSDFLFEQITFAKLKKGFLVKNDQGVDFQFNFVFALGCQTVFDFERGGNVMVNNAQLTNCNLFLQIGGGGRNVGTFLMNNVRVESSNAGKTSRNQILKSYPKWTQAHVKFIGFDDCQWDWKNNQTPERTLPLFDVGPGTNLVLESSIFNSPVASLSGTQDAPASLITRECSFSYVSPVESVSSNEYGYFKLTHNFTSKMNPLADIIKWPQIDPTILPSQSPAVGIPTP